MARPIVSEARKAAAAIQAARRMVSRGERPGYRLTPAQDGTWAVIGQPRVIVTAGSRREALSGHGQGSPMLEVDPGYL